MSLMLAYALYKLTNRNSETTIPKEKIEDLPTPAYQPKRHHQNASIIPDARSNINCEARDVYLASRVIMGGRYGGAVGMVEKYGVGFAKAVGTGGLSVLLDDAPDPFHHWCVVVGDYVHQLQSTSMRGGWNYYTNEEFSITGGWTSYKVGTTNFNDVAIVNSATNAMNDTDEVYDVLSNNCQHFALRLLDKILRDGRKKYKKLDQTYGLMATQPISLRESEVKMYRIGEEVSVEEKQRLIEPVIAKAPEVNIVPIDVADVEDAVEVGDRNGDVAVVASEEDHLRMMEEVLAIMIENTPSIKESAEAAKATAGGRTSRREGASIKKASEMS